MKLCVMGTGYVGLVAGAGFSDFGNEVVCVDVDASKIDRLRAGEIPIYEPGLDALVRHNTKDRRLSFTTDLRLAVAGAEVVFIAVGTPAGPDGDADLRYVEAAAEGIGRYISGFTVVVNKSTVPVGTAELVRTIVGRHTKQPFAVVSNPEFLKEGAAIEDFMRPDRVVLGVGDQDVDRRAGEIMRRLYAPIVRTNDRLLLMDQRSAELTKYCANAMLATRISCMNEIANLCERVGADVELVRRGVGSDPRIGASFLFPGIGYGGSCFPKDVQALLSTATRSGGSMEILEAVHRVNERQKVLLFAKILKHFGGHVEGRRIAVWGLSFKPGTDDIRQAPSLTLIEWLLASGAEVAIHDPVATPAILAELQSNDRRSRVQAFDDPYEALSGAHALALCTEWHEFRLPSFARMKERLLEPTLFDGRNVWIPAEAREYGFTYYGIGRR